MTQELIQLTFDKIMQTRSYTVIVLRGDKKRFAIYADPSVGKLLQIYLTKAHLPRPLTHDLIERIFNGLNIIVRQVVISDIQDTVYFSRLYLEQDLGGFKNFIEIDARPSDSITLALMAGAPLFCTREVLEKTVPFE